jgi:hypothetical protein
MPAQVAINKCAAVSPENGKRLVAWRRSQVTARRSSRKYFGASQFDNQFKARRLGERSHGLRDAGHYKSGFSNLSICGSGLGARSRAYAIMRADTEWVWCSVIVLSYSLGALASKLSCIWATTGRSHLRSRQTQGAFCMPRTKHGIQPSHGIMKVNLNLTWR